MISQYYISCEGRLCVTTNFENEKPLLFEVVGLRNKIEFFKGKTIGKIYFKHQQII